MSAATDKARFYLEQSVPELRELESKKIFDKNEIRAITRKRSDFEHKLCAPGSSPVDWARYIEYELNLDLLRRKRAKRMGARVAKHSGPRRMFMLLERATGKFHGDVRLWMQYLEYAKRQKAYRRISTVLTKVLRLHPAKPDLWIYAARYAFDEQGDITEGRSYMQRGLRFCPGSRDLWLAYFEIELKYLAKISARSRVLGVQKTLPQHPEVVWDEGGEDQVMLPNSTKESMLASNESEELISAEAAQALSKAPILSGAIPIAIFDAAMHKFNGSAASELAADMFEMTVHCQILGRRKILEHIISNPAAQNESNARAKDIYIRRSIAGLDSNTPEFALGLIVAIGELNTSLSKESAITRQMHILAVKWLVKYLTLEDLDKDIRTALHNTLARTLVSYQKLVENPSSSVWATGIVYSAAETVALLEEVQALGHIPEASALLEVANRRWPGTNPLRDLEQMTGDDQKSDSVNQ